MKTRIVTGVLLTTLLAVSLYFGGYAFSVAFAAMMCLSVYEIYKALRSGNCRCVEWPSWLCVIFSVPCFMEVNPSLMLVVAASASTAMLTTIMVMLRSKPKLNDIMMSCLPLMAVLLPGCCMLGLNKIGSGYSWNDPERLYSLMLIIMAIAIPLFGDMMAYFIGKFFGHAKLCPEVSPNKTVAGAIAGLLGSEFCAIIIWAIFTGIIESILPLWHFAILGFFCGLAGQAGDLFASLIKRTCGIKDFGSIFPGHGGAMDRLDSVYWATVVVYIYLNCIHS